MKSLIMIAITVTLFYSCKKDDSRIVFSLPEKTQTGNNTLGFMLGPIVWTNYGQVCFLFGSGCRKNIDGYHYKDGDIRLGADRVLYKKGSWSTSESISINLSTNHRGIGTYSSFANDTILLGYYYSEPGKREKEYVLSLLNPNFTVRLTKLDTAKKIIAGEFFGILFNRAQDTTNAISRTDSIIIADGRFDIKY